MNRTLALLTPVLAALILSGCAKNAPKSQVQTLNGLEYVALENTGKITSSDGRVSGTGSLVFQIPLAKIESSHSFNLQMILAEGTTLTLVSNADNKLANGVELQFARTGSALKASLSANGKTTDVSSKFGAIDAARDIELQIDVHNGEAPTHVLVWNGGISPLTLENALLNSEDEGLGCPGQGAGAFWGLKLNGAVVKSASVGEGHEVE